MICIKTRMRQKPKSCVLCSYYWSSRVYGEPTCVALGYKRTIGDHKPSTGRPKWCPLREAAPCLGEKE